MYISSHTQPPPSPPTHRLNVFMLFVYIIFQMRDLSHENVNQFIGLTIDPPNICILTKCAAKGSLSVRPDSEVPVILYYICQVDNTLLYYKFLY